MKNFTAALVCCVAFASTASAQLGNYLGPGILTRGAGDIGTRSGEQVDLRLFADVNGIYDSGIQPVSVDSKGNLVQVGGLYGVEAMIGVYGTHNWRVARLGLDYRGDFRHYSGDSYYDGSDHTLLLGYTYQKSRRLYFDLQGIGGTYSNYLGAVPGETSAIPNAINQSSLLLFDNRTDFVQGVAGMTYLLSPRLSVTLGGEGFYVHRQSKALVGVDGYGARGRIQYRVSRVTSLGAAYDREHFEFPNFFGNSDIDVYSGLFSTQLGRFWTLSLQGGVYDTKVVGLQTVALDPAIAALLGVSSVARVFAADNWVPSAQAALTRKFKTASLTFQYARTVVPGNGVYLTSRSETGTASYSYTGVQKTTLSVSGGYASLVSLGQGLPPYRSYLAGAGATYAVTHAIHAVARYDVREQQINIVGYKRSSYRVTLGIAFSPGSLPLSLW